MCSLMESIRLLPIIVAMSTSLVVAHTEEEVCQWESSRGYGASAPEAEDCWDSQGVPVTSATSDGCHGGEVYLFAEWTSSTGVLCSCVLLYISLVTITNIVVLYKFIATWNQITVSLREQNRVCVKYAKIRRLTCQEALKPTLYQPDDRNAATDTACPICLLDIKDQEYVASCDGGCATVFHKDCIYEWLNYKTADNELLSENHTCCPCCRKELLGVTTTDPAGKSTSSSGFLSDLSTLMGYYPY